MPEKSDIPVFRNLDGVYYRVVRDGKHVNSHLYPIPQTVFIGV